MRAGAEIQSTGGELILDGPQATAALGARIAAALAPGDLVTLSGPLGAGKSVLARGLVRALTSPDEEVPSPTFTLVQTYEGPRFPLAHLDLYRLKRPEEAWELGLEEAAGRRRRGGGVARAPGRAAARPAGGDARPCDRGGRRGGPRVRPPPCARARVRLLERTCRAPSPTPARSSRRLT